jgi:hypothetical protein
MLSVNPNYINEVKVDQSKFNVKLQKNVLCTA